MKNINPLVQKDLTADQLRRYVLRREINLQEDYNERRNGVDNETGAGKKIAGYVNLRKFYEGDHWSYTRDDGVPIRVYNYCRTTVLNYTSFLANEAPEDDVPPRRKDDPLEVARAEQVEKVLRDVKEDNDFPIVFLEAVQNQSLLGDSFLFGPYVEWVELDGKLDGDGKSIKAPRIRFKNIKKVENVLILWSDEDYNDMDGFILRHRISVAKAGKIYEEQLKGKGINSLEWGPTPNSDDKTGTPMCTVKTYWDDTYMLVLINDIVVDFVKHDWGFVPGLFVPNMRHAERPWGVSDIEDMLDSQVEYNETATATRGKINQVAVPHIFYSGEGEPVRYNAGEAQMIKLGPEDRVWQDPMGSSTAPFEAYSRDRKADIHKLSMISEIFYGGAMTAKATGRALSVLMQGVSNKVKTKQQYWKVALKKLNANILRLVEEYTDAGKQLIQGHYRTDVFFPSILVRDVTQEINKFNMKLQSQETTMKNLGIPSPKQEQKVMKREWNDMDLALEFSRMPQVRMQMQQQMQQQIQQQQGKGRPQQQQNPQLTEGAGGAGSEAEERQPTSAPGVPQQAPSSGEGAVGLKGFRGK